MPHRPSRSPREIEIDAQSWNWLNRNNSPSDELTKVIRRARFGWLYAIEGRKFVPKAIQDLSPLQLETVSRTVDLHDIAYGWLHDEPMERARTIWTLCQQDMEYEAEDL